MKRLNKAVLEEHGFTIKDFNGVMQDFYDALYEWDKTKVHNRLSASEIIYGYLNEENLFTEYEELVQASILERQDFYSSDREITALLMAINFLEKAYC